MELKTYFFDSYAFYELLDGNPNYDPYSYEISIVTTKLNLMELHYGLLRKYGKKVADRYYDDFLKFCVDVDDDSIKEANELKYFYKKRKLSYIDCLGYLIAKKRNVKFLTGDKQFEDMANVEFIK